MKRWKLAGAGLAALVALVVVNATAPNSRDTDSLTEGSASTATGSGANWTVHPSPPRRTTIHLPSMKAEKPQLLLLTRAMLERATLDGELSVRLHDGQRYRVVIENERLGPADRWTVVGRVQTRVGAQAMVLTFGPDAVFGVIPRPDGTMLHITTTRGKTEIADAGGLLPPGSKSTLATAPDFLVSNADGHGTGGKTAASSAPQMLAAQSATALTGVDIVVLGLYTNDLVTLRGSVSAAETEVTNLFAIANQAHVDSGTRVQFQLAGLRQVGIDPSLANNAVLSALTDDTVPGVDLSQLRDDMAADLVALVRPHQETDGTCGIAWLNGSGRMPETISDHYGISVSNVAPCGPLVLAHELGHNIGSAHDRETQAISGHLEYGAYQYSFGYREDGPTAFATVMAYSVGRPWIGYFSSPYSNSCGTACGVEDHEDNVRSLNAIAPIVAAFRGPPGTLSIVDAEIYEPETGSTGRVLFPVRLSGPAPAGGVHFDVTVSGGSAQAGVDYLAPAATGYAIAEGERVTYVTVEVVGDAIEEPDESIRLSLANVTGATVYDGTAMGSILNDDPRLTLSGRIRFEENVPPPSSEFWMRVTGATDASSQMMVKLSPPNFTYSLPIVKGASIQIEIDPPPPFAILPFTINEVESSRVRYIDLNKGFHVSGAVKLPAGQPSLTDPMNLYFRSSIDGVDQLLPPSPLEAPDFHYSQWVVPGAWVYMDLVPPAPYARFFAVHNDVHSDIDQDIQLSTLPALVIWGGNRIKVGPPGTDGSMEFVVELSAPAPAGGVQLHYRTVDGTASAGSDYTAIEGDLNIVEGQSIAYTAQLDWFGDDETEGNEDFYVFVSNVIGANPVVTSQRVTLEESHPKMSDPLPPRLAP